MAKRFYSKSYDTVSGNTYEVQIWDTEFASTAVEFETGSDIFTLNYAAEMRSKPFWVQPSQVSFQFYVDTAGKRTFVSDLNNASEGRFQVKIYKDGAFWWCGNVENDDTNYPDLESYFIEVKAGDGLGTLDLADFADDGVKYTGTDTLILIIQKALAKTGLLEFGWGASDVCIRTADNWYEDDMATGTASDPLALARTRHRALFDIDNQGNIIFKSALEVLTQVCQLKHLILKQSAGSWRLYQYGELAETTLTAERRYDRAGAYLSSAAAVDITKDLDQDEVTAAKENIVDFGWYTPLRKIEILYEAKNWVNYLAGASWSDSDLDAVTLDEIKLNGSQTKLRIKFDLEQVIDPLPFYTGSYVAVNVFYPLIVKIGDKYLRRNILSKDNYTVTYTNPDWTDTFSYYWFHQDVTNNDVTQTVNVTMAFDILTPALLESGTGSVQLGFPTVYDRGTGEAYPDEFAVTYTVGNSLLQVTTNGTPVLDHADKLYRAENDNLPTGETINLISLMGDGTTINTQGRLEIFNGSTWEDSDAWQIGGAGDTYDILELLAQSILANRKTLVRRMQGDVYDTAGDYEAHMRLNDTSSDAVWLMVRASYNARMERWSGDWFYIANSPTDITNTAVPVQPGIVNPDGKLIPPPPVVPPLPPTIGPSPGGNGPVTPNIGPVIGSTSTGGILVPGTVVSVATSQPLNQGAFQAGQVITIVNPVTGYQHNLTVTQTTTAGATSIAVSGYIPDTFPPGSPIIVSPQNATVQGFSASAGNDANGAEQTSNWWEIFQQWWEVDNTNDVDWPIEAPNVVFETDENAGDGATAGIRFDGDGLQSFSASSATPGVKVTTDGKLNLNNLDTGTGTTGLIVESGVVKQKTLPAAGVTDHGALTGLADDDHTQYHNDTRGDARYYTKTLLDAGQLDNRYFTESEHLNSSAGAGDAGKPVKLDAAGHIDASMINDADIDHGSISGLGDDDHTQYHNDTRGDARYYTKTLLDAGQLDNRYFTESEHLNSSAGAGDAGKPVKLDAAGHIDASMINDADIDHGSIGGLGDDDHTQYHNDTRGDARYYTKTLLDAGQLDNRYFTEAEHLNSSAGAGDAGKPVKLDAAGHIDATMINDADIDHGSIGGLGDDDHTQYAKLTGRSGGQTLQGGTGAGDDLTLESTTNATKGDIILADDVIAQAGFDFRTDQNAGNGSTAGVTIKDGDGIKGFKSTSATAVFYVLPTGSWEFRTAANTGVSASGIIVGDGSGVRVFRSTSTTPSFWAKNTGETLLLQPSHPTPEAGLIYQIDGFLFTANDGGTLMHPQLGHRLKLCPIGYSVSWSSGAAGDFIRFDDDYTDFTIYKITYGLGGATGSGSGTNSFTIYTTTVAGSSSVLATGLTLSSGTRYATTTVSKAITAGMMLHVVVDSSMSTPAQGLYLEIHLQKT